jgi:hypothetical protein
MKFFLSMPCRPAGRAAAPTLVAVADVWAVRAASTSSTSLRLTVTDTLGTIDCSTEHLLQTGRGDTRKATIRSDHENGVGTGCGGGGDCTIIGQ